MSGRSARTAAALSVTLTLALAAGTTSGLAAKPLPAIGYNLYFGDLHAHTSYSDGARGTTPADAFAAAQDAGADFMATTDHQGSLTSAEWADTMAAAASATSDEFVAIAGYEAWVVGIGEINVFGTEVWPKYPTGKGADKANSGHHGNRWDSLPAFYDWLDLSGAVGQWNHPTAYAGASSEDFADFEYRSADRDRGMGLIEVFNDVVYESSYTKALDAGWHVMPSANSDTHAADWISGSDVRTVLLAPSLTATGLREAMRASRGYATLDKNLCVGFTVNGEVMGSTLPEAVAEASIWVQANDCITDGADAITKVEIVSDGGKVVASPEESDIPGVWTATVRATAASYFYARISTASGADGLPGPAAWTAPVWTAR
jgi:hypothetical protein